MSQEACCDVYRTSRGVENYVVLILKGPIPLTETTTFREVVEKHSVASWNKDLCPRGEKRLEAKIDSGTSPSPPRKTGDSQ